MKPKQILLSVGLGISALTGLTLQRHQQYSSQLQDFACDIQESPEERGACYQSLGLEQVCLDKNYQQTGQECPEMMGEIRNALAQDATFFSITDYFALAREYLQLRTSFLVQTDYEKNGLPAFQKVTQNMDEFLSQLKKKGLEESSLYHQAVTAYKNHLRILGKDIEASMGPSPDTILALDGPECNFPQVDVLQKCSTVALDQQGGEDCRKLFSYIWCSLERADEYERKRAEIREKNIQRCNGKEQDTAIEMKCKWREEVNKASLFLAKINI